MIANGYTEGKLITPAQRRKIFVCRKELGLTDAALYFLLHQVTGKNSIRNLTQDEAAAFIDELVARGASGQGRYPKDGQRKPPARRDPQTPQVTAPRAHPGVSQPPLPGTNIIPLATDEQLVEIERLLQHLNLSWDSPEFLAIVREVGVRRGIKTMAHASRAIGALRVIRDREVDQSGDTSTGGCAK